MDEESLTANDKPTTTNMDNNNGGPAFPTITYSEGMTLRDYFAAQALLALISKIPPLKDRDPQGVAPMMDLVTEEVGRQIRSGVARCAYTYADEMLKARQ